MAHAPAKKPRLTLTTQIFIGLILGVAVGFLVNRYYAIELNDPLLSALRHGELDLCIATLPRKPDSDLHQVALFDNDLVVVARDQHPLHARRTLRVADLAGEGLEGIALGIDADGALRLRRDDGGESRVVAGDVTVVKEGP